ncbi:universal stress protein [Dokdonia sp. Asnod2-E02]|uniref:universal stress protein n=1 Tax=Dokdonia sp. Asnod2-E02 TaxID=3160574 RepID=UPI0038664964
MAHILVPTDFSNNAYNALYYATRLYPNEKCEITLIHTFEDQFSSSTSRVDIGRNEKLYEDLERNALQKLSAVKKKIEEDSESLNIDVAIVTSAQPLHKMVNRIVADENIDFVAMGTKGASGLKEVFVGTQAVKLINNVKPIPLFLVPAGAQQGLPSNIAYATDLKIDYAQYPLEIVKEVMRAHKAKLHITHIYNQISPGNTVENNYRKLKDKLADVEYNTHWLSSETGMETAVTTFVSEHKIDLLVLMFHKSGFLKKIFKKSFVETSCFHTHIPLLVLPESY